MNFVKYGHFVPLGKIPAGAYGSHDVRVILRLLHYFIVELREKMGLEYFPTIKYPTFRGDYDSISEYDSSSRIGLKIDANETFSPLMKNIPSKNKKISLKNQNHFNFK